MGNRKTTCLGHTYLPTWHRYLLPLFTCLWPLTRNHLTLIQIDFRSPHTEQCMDQGGGRTVYIPPPPPPRLLNGPNELSKWPYMTRAECARELQMNVSGIGNGNNQTSSSECGHILFPICSGDDVRPRPARPLMCHLTIYPSTHGITAMDHSDRENRPTQLGTGGPKLLLQGLRS